MGRNVHLSVELIDLLIAYEEKNLRGVYLEHPNDRAESDTNGTTEANYQNDKNGNADIKVAA